MKRETVDQDQVDGAGVSTLAGTVATAHEPGEQRFVIPAESDRLVRRSRLFEGLEHGVSGPLTLVSAPAGTGKTALVSAWAARVRARGPVVWVTLEAKDETRECFWASIATGMARCGVVIPLPSGPTDAAQAGDGHVDRMVSGLLGRGELPGAEPVVMVLDCEHGISAEVAEDLDLVLRRSGGWLRLVVLSRVDPVLPLHRYRLAGTVVEIRMADLAFTLDEARELMSKAGVVLSGDALKTVVDRTQGWAAGLRFAAVFLARAGDQARGALEFRGDTGDVADYLIAEVLDAQPEPARQLLLETSVVETIRPGLGEAVAGPHAQRALAVLARGNAFVHELADSPGCYRYQPLFHELLRAQLVYESPERAPELHRAVAAWMADQGIVEAAVRHSAAADDWEGAARYLIDDLAIGRLLLPGGEVLASVLSRLPDNTPGVAATLCRAALAMAASDVQGCEEQLLRAEDQLETQSPRWNAAALALQTVRLTHAAAVADVEGGLGAAAAAERLMHLKISDRLDEHPELLVLIESGRGAAWLATGQLDDAAEAFSAGARAAERPGCEAALVSCLGHLALLSAMRGQLRRAADLAARVAVIQQEAHLDPAACPSAAVAQAWVSTELYDLPSARRHAQRAAESMSFAYVPMSRVMLALVDARVRRARGDVNGALARIAAARSETAQSLGWLQDLLGLEEAELNLAGGQPALAVGIVEELSEPESSEATLVLARARMAIGEAFESPATTLRSAGAPLPTRVGGWLFEATRQLQDGDEPRAGQALERSLLLAAPERLRRPFREASPQVRRLLRADPQLAAEHSWLGAATLDDVHPLQRRRDAEPDTRRERPETGQLLEPLTEKEREVLGHLAALLTTDEIAGAMFVSVNTVRTHVRNILRKLAASRRNEAVRRARELGIIPGWTAAEPAGGTRPA